MKKPVIALAALVIAAFGVISFLRRDSGNQTGPASEALNPEKQRIKTFWTLYDRANSDRLAGKFERAVAGYRECLKLDPKHEDSLYYLATSLKELGEYKEAVATFERLIEVNPESNRAWSELGNTLCVAAPGTRPDFKRARSAFERSIEINREQAGPFLQLGRLELNLGDTTAARKHFEIAAGFGSPEGNFLVGYTFFLEKKQAEASKLFRKVLEGQARERAIASRGIVSEGDILPALGKPMTALESASLKSLLFLYWSAARLGVYPHGVPKEFQLNTMPPAAGVPPPFHVTIGAEAQGTPDASCEEFRRAGLPVQGAVSGCAQGDFNADGLPDFLVLRWQRGVLLYLNQGGGRFSEATQEAGLSGAGGRSFSAIAFDYDKDGKTDIFISYHAPFEEVVRCLVQPGYKPLRYTSRLFHNSGNGRFEDASISAGLTRCYGVMKAIATDLDSDGWVDLLLVNGSFDRQRLEPSIALRNLGGKEFREWFYVPSFESPGNFTGATLRLRGGGGKPELRLVRAKVGQASRPVQ